MQLLSAVTPTVCSLDSLLVPVCSSQIVQKPSFLKFRHLQYLIIDAPTDRNLHQYVKEFAKFGVTDLVRACPPSYETDAVVSAGIKVHVRGASLCCRCCCRGVTFGSTLSQLV